MFGVFFYMNLDMSLVYNKVVNRQTHLTPLETLVV